MNRGTTLFLKGAVLAIGTAALAFCVFVLPEGIASDRTGYYRPILLGMYASAIPFFFALIQAHRLLRNIDVNEAFSESTVRALKNIKYSGIAISLMYIAQMPYIFSAADKDDAPGVVAIGLVIIFASFVIATFAAVLQKLVKTAMDIKSENDLTV